MAIDKDQIALATQLNSLIDSMAKGSVRLEQSFETQVSIVERLAKAMGQVDTRQTRKELDALNDTKLDSLQKAIDDTTSSSSSMLGKLQEVAETLEKKFPTSAAIAVAGLSGLHQGIRNMIAMTKGATSFFSTVAGGLFNITASVIAIPFKLLTGLVGFAANATMGSNELRQAIEALRKEFGALSGPTNKTITTMSFSLKGFKDTGLSTWRVFGTLAERFQAFRELAHNMGPDFQLLTNEFKQNGGAILAYQKGLGISNEEMKGVADRAIASNQTFASVLKDVTKFSLEMGKSFGIDGKLISRDMGKALGDVKHFAGATVKQIAEADVFARKLGLSLDKITGTLDAFETFDSAAENVAKLSQAFGVQVDAFKLMEKQDPASQLDELRKAFLKTGKSADTMSRQELKLLAQTTGLDEATARMAFSAKNQGVSMDEIRKKSAETEKKTLTQAEAMKKLADSIERLVKQGGNLPNSFFAAFIKGFLGGVQASKPFRMMIYDIRESLRVTIREGVKLGRTFVDIFPGIKDLFTGLDQLFKPKKFKVFIGSIREIFTQFFKDLASGGDWSFSDFMDNIQATFFDFFNVEAPAGRQALSGFKTFFQTIVPIAAAGTRWIADKIAEGISSITDFIRDPKKMLQRLGGTAKGGGSFIAVTLAPMLDSLEHAWTVITPALTKLFKVVGNKLVAFLKSDDFKSVAVPVAGALVGVLFGPVFTHVALAAGTAALARASVGMFTGAGKKGISAIIEKAGSVAQNMINAKKMGQGAETIASSGSLLKAGSVASEAAKGSSAIDFKSLGQKLLALIAVVTAVGLVSAGIAWLLKKVASPKELDAAGTIMLKMSGVFLAMIPLLAASTAIGAVVDLSAGAVLIPMATGFGVIAGAVGLMALAAVGIIKSLSALKIDADFQPKINAFLSVMQAIGTFTGAIVSIVNAATPSLLDFISGKSETFSTKIGAATKLVRTMSMGMVGIVGQIVNAIAALNIGGPGVKEAAETFSSVLSSITSFMNAAKPPPAFYEAGNSFLARLVGGKSSFKDLSASVSTYVGVVRDGAMKILLGDGGKGGIIDVIKVMTNIKVPDPKAVEAVTGLLAATAQIIAALTPSPETIKAFSYSVEKSAAFGLIKNASSAIDTKGMADVMTTMGMQLKTLLPIIMSTVTGSIVTQAAKIGDKLDSVKALTEAFRAIIDLSSSLGNIAVKPQGDQSGLLDAVQRIVGKDGSGGQVTMASDLIASSQGAISGAIKNVQGFGHSMQKVADAIKTGGVVAALGAVEQMVKQANSLDTALNAGSKINIPAKLEAVARGVGLGKSGTFKVTNKDVVINVNFEISMDVDKVEKVMVLRQKSILRDRLNYLTDASRQPQLPDNTSSPVAPIKQGTP